MGKQREDSSDKFMSYSNDSHLKRKTFFSSSVKIEPEVIVMEDNALSHKPYNSSQVSIASLRDFTFSFKVSGLIDSGVNTTEGNNFFVRGEIFDISNFSKEVDSGYLTNSFNREEDVEFFREGGIFRRKFKEDTGKFFEFLLKEKEFFNFFREDNFFQREVGRDRIFSKGEDFRGCEGAFSTSGGGVEEGINCFWGEIFDGVSGGKRGKEVEDRFGIDVNNIFKLREKDREEFFDVVFNFGNFLRGNFSFSCDVSDVIGRGVLREAGFEGKEEEGDGFGVNFISFSFSQGRFNEFRKDEGIEEDRVKFFRGKEREEVDVVRAGGFTSKDDGFFGEGGDFSYKRFKAEVVHRELFLKKDGFRIFKGTDRERMFRDINTNENFKTHRITSNIKYFDGAGHCRPILHVDKGLRAQPTYNGLRQRKANSFEGLEAQVKWSCPALFYVNDSGKTRSYKFYTINSL